MKWLVPFHRVTSTHLGLGLWVARILAWVGFLLLAAAVVMFLMAPSGALRTPGFGIPLQHVSAFIMAGWALAALLLSSVLAALVGIEEGLRRTAGSNDG